VIENERYMRQGALFHRLLQQFWLGVPAERLAKLIHDEDLGRWWDHFLQDKLVQEGLSTKGFHYPEISSSAPLEGYRLVAKFDLLRMGDQGTVTIYDWKTARKRPRRDWLQERLQTRVYPYLLVRAGTQLNGGEQLHPDQVEMIYWFADFPDQPEHFKYNRQQFEQDEAYLTGLLQEILGLVPDAFGLTSQIERCAFCVYRSLCDRGEQAGTLGESAGELEGEVEDIFLDFDQIAEIEF